MKNKKYNKLFINHISKYYYYVYSILWLELIFTNIIKLTVYYKVEKLHSNNK